jgi:flagellar hook-associated protein 3 FlgL
MTIADLSLFSSLGSSLDSTEGNIQEIETELATGKDVNQPSDNPTAYASAQVMNAEQSAISNDLLLGQQVQSQLNTASSALSNVSDAIDSAMSIATEGSNGGIGISAMQALGSQVQSIQQEVIGAANSQYGGVYLFGGDQVQTPPYSTAGVYTGTAATNAVTFSDGVTVQTNTDGLAVFGDNSTGLIATLGALAAALNSGNQSAVAAALTQLQTALATVATAQGSLGGNLTAANNVVSNAPSQGTALQASVENLVGTDVAQAAAQEQEGLLQQQALVSLGSELEKIPLINIVA